MARRSRRSRRGRRGTVRPGKRPAKFTPVKLGKLFIALTPPAVAAYEGAKSGGIMGGSNALLKAYSGYDFEAKQFAAENLLVGYLPLAAAWGFGKIASRVIRF